MLFDANSIEINWFRNFNSLARSFCQLYYIRFPKQLDAEKYAMNFCAHKFNYVVGHEKDRESKSALVCLWKYRCVCPAGNWKIWFPIEMQIKENRNGISPDEVHWANWMVPKSQALLTGHNVEISAARTYTEVCMCVWVRQKANQTQLKGNQWL